MASFTISTGHGDCSGDRTALTTSERIARIQTAWELAELMRREPGVVCWATLRDDRSDRIVGTITGQDGLIIRDWKDLNRWVRH